MIDPSLPRCISITRRRFLAGLTAATVLGEAPLAFAAGNPVARAVVDGLLPPVFPYPPANPGAITDEARRLSDAILQHVEAFLDGRAPAELPASAVPRGLQRDERAPGVSRPGEVTPEDYWIVRPAETRLDLRNLRGLYPDPHCTYLVPGLFLAPFGTRVVIEGEFPACRFFSIQVTPPFAPGNYYYNGAFGVNEVPLVDVDIDPLPDHTNPFRPGANRRAAKRSYAVEWLLREGDGSHLEPAYRPPHYRAAGNRRLGSGIVHQGPLGTPGVRGGHGLGTWAAGALWLRYYAPDRRRGPLAGVPLPRVTYRLPDGRAFLISIDKRAKETRLNRTFAAPKSAPADPDPAVCGREVGWMRDLDIFHGGIVGIFRGVGKNSAADKAHGRALVRGAVGKDEDLPAPGFYASSASRAPHITYLSRGMSLGRGRVIVLTGRLPRHPRTLDGQARMDPGQVRYFSLTTYPNPELFHLDRIGVPTSSVMDEEILTDAQGRYVICYSRPDERPANATVSAGVTWVDWGPASVAGWTLRWLTVHPEHKDVALTPDETRIGYGQASWLSPRYEPGLVGINGASSVMKDFLPRIHYLRRDEFELLGAKVDPANVPAWT